MSQINACLGRLLGLNLKDEIYTPARNLVERNITGRSAHPIVETLRLQRNWHQLLSCIELSLNTSINTTTGVTPFEMVYGRKALLPTCHLHMIAPSRSMRRVNDSSEQISIIYEMHVNAGHAGFEKTKDIISQRYYWPGMIRDIRRFVATCRQCKR